MENSDFLSSIFDLQFPQEHGPRDDLRRLEFDWRRLSHLFVRTEGLAHLEPQEIAGRQVGREKAHAFIVLGHFLDVALSRHGDAVLSPLQLSLEVAVVLIGLKLRVALDHYEESRQSAGKLSLGLLKALERLGVAEGLGIDFYLRRFASRLDHFRESLLFELRCAFNYFDQGGHESGAALILVLHLAPGGLDILVQGLEGVVTTSRQR